jgi:hypothetical protein
MSIENHLSASTRPNTGTPTSFSGRLSGVRRLLTRLGRTCTAALVGQGEQHRLCDPLEQRAMLAADLTTNISSPTGGTFSRGAQYAGVVMIANQGDTLPSDARVNVQIYLSSSSTYNGTTAQPLSGATALFIGIMFSGQFKEDNFVFTIPNGTADGRYYLFARVDPSNTIGESNEANNISGGASIIVNNSGGGGGEVPDDPEIDLRASVTLLTPTLIVNSPITVRVNISNAGTDALALPGTFAQLFMTRSTAANPSADTPVGDSLLNIALTPSQVESREVTFTLPESQSTGVVRFYAVVDQSNQTVETNENNNVSNLVQGQFNLTVRDITGSAISNNLPTQVVEGAKVSGSPIVTYSIRNSSDFAMASGTSIGVRGFLRPVFSGDASLDIAASDQRTESLSRLAAQATRERTLRAKVPANLAAGEYRYVIVLDNTNRVAEINENNNTIDTGVIISIVPKTYDPAVTAVNTQLPEVIQAGRKSNVTITLNNLGNSQYKGNGTFIFSIFDASGVEVSSQSITKRVDLRPGRNVRVSGLGVTAPTALGVYRVTVRLALPDAVSEVSLFNNQLDLRPITVS